MEWVWVCGGVAVVLLPAWWLLRRQRDVFHRFLDAHGFTPAGSDWGLSEREMLPHPGIDLYPAARLGTIRAGFEATCDGFPIFAAQERTGSGDEQHSYYLLAVTTPTEQPFYLRGGYSWGAFPEPGAALLRQLSQQHHADLIVSNNRTLVIRTISPSGLQPCLDAIVRIARINYDATHDAPWP